MKKSAIIALALLLCLSLAACRMSNNDETTAPTTAPTTVPTTAPTTVPTIPAIDPTIDTNIPDPEVDPNSTTPTIMDEGTMTPDIGQ